MCACDPCNLCEGLLHALATSHRALHVGDGTYSLGHLQRLRGAACRPVAPAPLHRVHAQHDQWRGAVGLAHKGRIRGHALAEPVAVATCCPLPRGAGGRAPDPPMCCCLAPPRSLRGSRPSSVPPLAATRARRSRQHDADTRRQPTDPRRMRITSLLHLPHESTNACSTFAAQSFADVSMYGHPNHCGCASKRPSSSVTARSPLGERARKSWGGLLYARNS